MATYSDKAKDNFNAKLPIYLFSCCIKDKEPTYNGFLEFELSEEIIHQYASIYLQAERNEKIQRIDLPDLMFKNYD